MTEIQKINWFPGHMAKARREIENDLKKVHFIIEVLDARVPFSSRPINLENLVKNKPVILILNKSDLSDPRANLRWNAYYQSLGFLVCLLDAKTGKDLKDLFMIIKNLEKKFSEKSKLRGIKKTFRGIVLGTPNVGKSSVINKLSNRKNAKVQNKPGVTRDNQWFLVNNTVEILDTPGILSPNFSDKSVSEKLAFCGTIKDSIIDIEGLSLKFIELLKKNYDYFKFFLQRYSLDINLYNHSSLEILKAMGEKKGLISKGNKVDILRTATLFINDFRAGKIGKITLDSFKEC